MKRLRIGINGFGRIGRAIFRLNHRYDLFDVVVINDINPDVANLAYLLRYDSVHGAFPDPVLQQGNTLSVKGQETTLHCHADIREVPWHAHGVDVLIDAAGLPANAAAIASLAKRPGHYIHTHATDNPAQVKTVVFGVNEGEFEAARHRVISASICDTVALGPILKLMQDRYGIECGFLTTLHPWLAAQNLMDGHADAARAPDAEQSHYALGRSAINNLIPKATTAVMAADALFPGISGKIESFSYRVPTNIVSSAVLNLVLSDAVSKEGLIDLFHGFARTQTWNILENSAEPKVSLDYSGNAFSAALDHRWTAVKNGRNIRLVYWYDNEWGYSARVVDIVKLIAQQA